MHQQPAIEQRPAVPYAAIPVTVTTDARQGLAGHRRR
jgi:hypothetical protein